MAAMAAILKIYFRHLENLFFASSTELKGKLIRNLVGSIGMTGRLKIAKMVPV